MQNTLIIFGAKYLVFLMLIIAVVAFVFLQLKDKKKAVIFSAFVLPVSFITARILSFFFYNSRPFVVENVQPLIAHVADNGFPSDHTLLASAVSAIVFAFNKKVGIALWIMTFAVGASRVLAKVHHAVDVLGSMLVVILVVLVFEKFLLPLVEKKIK